MTQSSSMNASQYTKIHKIDFLYQNNEGVVKGKLLTVIESGTKVNYSNKKTALIIGSFGKKLRRRNTPCIIALAFCVCVCLICILSIVNGKISVTNIDTLMFMFIPLFIVFLLVKVIRDKNRISRKICNNPNEITVTVRTYPIRDMFVLYGVDDDAEYYIMLDEFAVCIGKEPNLFAKRGLSLSAAVIEIEGNKYFTTL